MLSKSKIYNSIFSFNNNFRNFLYFFSEKNLFVLFKNEQKILSNKILLTEKKELKKELEKKINSFSNSEIYKELILKEKIIFKNENDKVILYELD